MNTAILRTGVNTATRANNLIHGTARPRTNCHNPIFNKYLDKNFTGVFLKTEVVLYVGLSVILVLFTSWSLRGCCAGAVQADYRTAGHRRVEDTTTGTDELSAAAISNASPASVSYTHLTLPTKRIV